MRSGAGSSQRPPCSKASAHLSSLSLGHQCFLGGSQRDGLGFLRRKVSQRPSSTTGRQGKRLQQWPSSPLGRLAAPGGAGALPYPCLCTVLEALPFPCTVTWAGIEPVSPALAGEFSPLSPLGGPWPSAVLCKCVWLCGVSSACNACLPFVSCFFSDPVLCQAGHELLQSRDCFMFY